jgi:oligopeptide/dipeptide ABC transporter ATP-binding protein
VLYRGQLVEQGPAEQVYQEPRHPYTRALLQAVPRLGGAPPPQPAPPSVPAATYAPARPAGS